MALEMELLKMIHGWTNKPIIKYSRRDFRIQISRGSVEKAQISHKDKF